MSPTDRDAALLLVDARSHHGPVVHADGRTTVRVWAPHAADVTLALDDRDVALAPAAPGWWETTVRAGHGDRYAFRLDGGPLRPDPASRAQPEGVHAPSALVDPRRLARAPLAADGLGLDQAVIYELHVGTFTPAGTLDAAIEHLPRLAALGITHVELLPVAAFDGDRGWGYDGVLWFATHRAYGGPEALARFVAAAHATGLAVLLDVVHNHLGPSGSYLPDFGPYTAQHAAGHWGAGMNLDGAGSDAVRALLCDNGRWWLGALDLDGLRLDAVHALLDGSATPVLAALRDAADEVAAARGRPATLIAESDRNDPRELRPRAHGGLGMDGVWADELHHGLHVALTGERQTYLGDSRGLPDVAAAYRRGFVHDGSRPSPFRGHSPGAPLPPEVPGSALVGCLQNHDQVGNRARGDRITTLADPAAVRAAIALLVAAPHTPMLFAGDEHGATQPWCFFVGFEDPELVANVRAGRRREMAGNPGFDAEAPEAVPDPDAWDTFARSRLDWTAADTPAGRARTALWADLLALRRAEPALHAGPRHLVDLAWVDDTALVCRRGHPDADPVLVTANLAAAPRTLAVRWRADLPALPGRRTPSAWSPALATDDRAYGGAGEAATWDGDLLTLPARSAVLWRPTRA